MTVYKYFIYKIESIPDAEGEYIGPFSTEVQRDQEADALRKAQGKGRVRPNHVYRVNIDAEMADELTRSRKEAA